MAENILKRLEALVNTGTQLVPLGGFEFSGYNARLQSKYLEWRKSCIEILDEVGPIGFPYKNKIVADTNGGFFFQSSAQLILTNIKELFEKLKASPEFVSQSAPQPTQQAQQPQASSPTAQTATQQAGTRVIKPPPKPTTTTPPPSAPVTTPPPAQPTPVANGGNKVYVIGEVDDNLKKELSQFLKEIGVEEISIVREPGKMLSLNNIQEQSGVKYAFFVLNAQNLAFAMFELGHFVGKLGPGQVCVLHKPEVQFPAGVPGVTVKQIVVRLEEASFSIIKELKAEGLRITI